MCCALRDTGIALFLVNIPSELDERESEELSCLVNLKNDSHFGLIMHLQNLYKSQVFNRSAESSRSGLRETEFHAVDLS